MNFAINSVSIPFRTVFRHVISRMTKLLEWLSVFIVFLSAYVAILTRQIQAKFLDEWMLEITLLPIVAIGLFGVRTNSSIYSVENTMNHIFCRCIPWWRCSIASSRSTTARRRPKNCRDKSKKPKMIWREKDWSCECSDCQEPYIPSRQNKIIHINHVLFN